MEYLELKYEADIWWFYSSLHCSKLREAPPSLQNQRVLQTRGGASAILLQYENFKMPNITFTIITGTGDIRITP